MKLSTRSKLFLENLFIYGLGGMISKLIPMIMLPLITRLYPSSEYIALNDLSQTLISFAQALAVCGMYDAMFRMFFDYTEIEEQKKVCSTALAFVIGTTVIISIIGCMLRENIALLYFGDRKYDFLVIITIVGFVLSSTNQIVSAPTRIKNKRKVFLISNTISSLLSYAIAIPLIIFGFYIIAIPIAYIIAIFSVEMTFVILNREYFAKEYVDKKKVKELLIIGLPLLPNFLIYWIYNSADKIMISHLLGNEATGVYSVASKIGHISNLIYIAFAGGWQYFAYSTMLDDDQVQLKSNIFEYLEVISYAATVLLISVSKFSFTVLFPEQYLQGYVIAPYLFLSPLLLMLYQVIANQFTIVKKTYMNFVSLSIGAIVNLIFNYFFIRYIGIEGAAIATITGYLLSELICLFCLNKMRLIIINRNVIVNTLIIIVFFLIWRFFLKESYMFTVIVAVIVEFIYGFIYRKHITKILNRVIRERG